MHTRKEKRSVFNAKDFGFKGDTAKPRTACEGRGPFLDTMEFIKPGTHIDFIGRRKIAFAVSGMFIIATIILLIWRDGPNFGVDFSGGVLVQVKLDQKHTPTEIKSALAAIHLEDSIIQEFGEEGQHEYLIRVRETNIELAGLNDKIKNALTSEFGQGVEIRRVEMVGPKVGEDLRQKALFAIFYAILFIAIYISGRFELKWLMRHLSSTLLRVSGLASPG